MSHTHTRLVYHCIFSTDGRRQQLKPATKDRVHAYIRGIVQNSGGCLLRIGGTADHVHLLLELEPDVSVAQMMRLVKTNSSKWIHETFPAFGEFQWQPGYAAFTVSESAVGAVAAYIERQEAHHRTQGFEEELAMFMARHGLTGENE